MDPRLNKMALNEVETHPPPSPNPCYPIITTNGRVTSRIYHRRDTCIVYQVNAVSCNLYGIAKDLNACYPHEHAVSSRHRLSFVDRAIRWDRDVPGNILIQHPVRGAQETSEDGEIESTLPTLIAMVTQFGYKPFDNTKETNDRLNQSRDFHYVEGVKNDIYENRLIYFKECINKLVSYVTNSKFIKQVVIPAGLGQSGRCDTKWNNVYLPIIHSAAIELNASGIQLTMVDGMQST